MAHKYFSYDHENGFDTFATAEEAKAHAQESIDWYRDNQYGCWDDAVETIVWGEIKQEAAQFGNRPVAENDNVDDGVTEICDYQLQSIDQKTGEFGGFNTLAEQVADLIKVWMLTADNNVSITLENSQGNQVIFAYVRSEGILESVVTDHITIYCAKDDASARIMDAIHMIARHINMTQYKKYQSYTA